MGTTQIFFSRTLKMPILDNGEKGCVILQNGCGEEFAKVTLIAWEGTLKRTSQQLFNYLSPDNLFSNAILYSGRFLSF